MLEHARGLLRRRNVPAEDGRHPLAATGRTGNDRVTNVSRARALAVPSTRRRYAHRCPDATFSISEGLSAALCPTTSAPDASDVVALYNAQPVPENPGHRNVGDERLFLVSARPRKSERRAPPDPLPLARLPEFRWSSQVANAIRMHVESRALAAIGARPNIALEIDGVPAISMIW